MEYPVKKLPCLTTEYEYSSGNWTILRAIWVSPTVPSYGQVGQWYHSSLGQHCRALDLGSLVSCAWAHPGDGHLVYLGLERLELLLCRGKDLTMDVLPTGKWLFAWFLQWFRPPQRERLVSWVLFAFSDLPHYRWKCHWIRGGGNLAWNRWFLRMRTTVAQENYLQPYPLSSIDGFDRKTISCTWKKVKEYPRVWRQDLLHTYMLTQSPGNGAAVFL